MTSKATGIDIASPTRRAQTSEAAGPSSEAQVLAVTPAAFRRVGLLLEREGMPGGALRVGIRGGGCAGYSYTLKLEPGEPRPDDLVIRSGKLRVHVDPKSARLLAGTVLDFSEGLNGKGFEFNNPNAVRTCGCGTSFTA